MCEGKTVAATRPKAFERDGRLVLVREMLAGPVDQAVGHYTPAA
jgi:hypothetical protein